MLSYAPLTAGYTCDDKSPATQLVAQSKSPTLYHPNPFAPHGGAKEWCSNELILHDNNMRCMARVCPLDCGLKEMIKIDGQPQL